MSVHLVGVGPGPVDLLTVRASRLIALSRACLYPRGGIGPEVAALCPPATRVVDTTGLAPHELGAEIRAAVGRGEPTVALFAGDPAQHPGLDDLVEDLDSSGIRWEVVPGVPLDTARAPVAPPAAAPHPAHPPTSPGRILVLGGTDQARRLADLMVGAGLDVVTALSGTMSRPRPGVSGVRLDDLGGADDLTRWLVHHAVGVVIDATDPFTPEITAAALQATATAGVPLLRLTRPAGEPGSGDDWIRVPGLDEAARVVRERFRRPMLAVGVQGPSAFAGDTRGSYLIRCAEPPPDPLPQRYLLVLDRGPFDPDSERTLMSRHRIDALVTRNTGGPDADATLTAARDLRLPVVMVDRPAEPALPDLVDTVESVEEAARWLVERFGSR